MLKGLARLLQTCNQDAGEALGVGEREGVAARKSRRRRKQHHLVTLNSIITPVIGIKQHCPSLLRVCFPCPTTPQVIAKAKVPIIKFETVDHGGLNFDISFDVPNGPQVMHCTRCLKCSGSQSA